MSGVKISALPAADAANDTDQIEVNQDGTSRRVTVGQVATLVQDAIGAADGVVSVGDYGAIGDGVADDTAAVTSAVATCLATGAMLFWPAGTYLTTASISNLHAVRHRGPGIIKRGADLFAVEPADAAVNTLYCAVAGGAANDGLSSSQPLTTSGALAALVNYGPTLNGKWKVALAAGTYDASTVSQVLGLQSRKLLEINGPDVGGHPGVPTAILNGSGSAGAGLRFGVNMTVKVSNLKFINFDGGASGSGIVMQRSGLLVTDNVHTDNCSIGINSQSTILVVNGGIINVTKDGAYGIRSLAHNFHSIGYSYSEATGNASAGNASVFTGNGTGRRGMFVAERSTGHVIATFSGFEEGVAISTASRVHFDIGCDIRLCTVGVMCYAASDFQDDGITFNDNTVNANGVNFVFRNYGSTTNEAQAVTSRMVAQVLTPIVLTNTLPETLMHALPMPPGQWTRAPDANYAGKVLRCNLWGTLAGVVQTKTLRWRVATTATGATGTGAGSVAFAAATVGTFAIEYFLRANGPATQVIDIKSTVNGSATAIVRLAGAYNFATTSTGFIKITGDLNDLTDTITIEGLSYEVWG